MEKKLRITKKNVRIFTIILKFWYDLRISIYSWKLIIGFWFVIIKSKIISRKIGIESNFNLFFII
jgi:ABC-type spermidine/putrescine transport system permease subunit I